MHLQKNKLLFFSFLMMALPDCANTQYKVFQRDGENTGLLISPDRVLVECEDLHAKGGDRPGSFGFIIHILDEEKTVLTGIQTTQTSKNDCLAKVKLAEKILKNSKQVYIAGRVDLDETRTTKKWTSNFPKHGTFHDNGRSMSFSVLKGEDGTCVTAHEGYGKPCPWDPIFPVDTIPF